jgi:hypothetical protein
MDRGQWLEAAQNFVTFLEGYWSDREHDRHQTTPRIQRASLHLLFRILLMAADGRDLRPTHRGVDPPRPSQPHQRCERRRRRWWQRGWRQRRRSRWRSWPQRPWRW